VGHSTITLTADTYTSVLPETARAAAKATAALLFPVTRAARAHPRPRRSGTRRACLRSLALLCTLSSGATVEPYVGRTGGSPTVITDGGGETDMRSASSRRSVPLTAPRRSSAGHSDQVGLRADVVRICRCERVG
jgi:hypothetical protein